MAGDPSHFEIGVPDERRAKTFYGELLAGRSARRRARTRGSRLAAYAAVSMTATTASKIVVYFRVPDIEAAVRRVRELGGEAKDPGPGGEGGRFTSCRDDQGVQFGLHQPDDN